MVEALTIITSISVLLLIGIICSAVAKRVGLPDVLLLLIAGMLIGVFHERWFGFVDFPILFLTTLSLLALALVVFNSSAKLRLRELDTLSLKSLKLVVVFTTLSLVVFSYAGQLLLDVPLSLGILFATMIVGTSPDIMLNIIELKHKLVGILKLESVFNTPLTVLLPFIVVDFIRGSETASLPGLLTPFLTKIVMGLGAGIFIGVILFKLMQKAYSPLYSPLAVIISALLTFVLAENLGGNGVLAVITLGVFFGNVSVKEKIELLSVESVLSKALFIFVFLLLGITIKLPVTGEFLLRSFLLFAVYIFVRLIAVNMSFHKEKFTKKEVWFLTLNAPKGISTAAVVFIFAIYNTQGTIYYIPGISVVLDTTLMFILYSILVSAFACGMKKYFIEANKTR